MSNFGTVIVFDAERMLEIEQSTIVSGSINAQGRLILKTRAGTDIDAGTALAAIPVASTAEVTAGTDNTKFLTAANVRQLTPSSSRVGLIELATLAEVNDGTDTSRAVTPYTLKNQQGFRPLQTVKFETSGTFSKANYPGIKAVRVRVVGGGGGGGGAVAAGSGAHSCGGGGGGGGYAESFVLATALPDNVTVTVGAGGTGVAGDSGTFGGVSSFGTFAEAGGGGRGHSIPSTALSIAATGGGGGNGSVGDVLAFGDTATFGHGNGSLGIGGSGGGSMLGGGAPGVYTGAGSGSLPGNAGRVYGGGGGGAQSNAGNTTAQPGGAGAQGVVLVEVFV